VQDDLNGILQYYAGISEELADGFWEVLTGAIGHARRFPERHHFDPSGRRRCNLKRFPYHFLFKASEDEIKVMVVRHHSRSPGFGGRRK